MAKKLIGVRRRGRKTFEIRYYDGDGIRQHETVTAKTASEAAGIRAARLSDIAKGIPVSSKPNTVLFEELCADVVNHYRVNNLTSMPDIETRYRLHILPAFGKRKAATISTAQLNHYIIMRKSEKEPPATGTINRELEAIRRAFKFAYQGRKILHMPHIPMLREDNVRSGFFTREEVERLCSHLKAPLDSFVRFAFLTGWRYGEIQSLQWSNVDFRAGEIRLDAGKTKNREGRVFPMSSELRRTLELIAAATISATRPSVIVAPIRMPTPSAFVFTIHGRPIGAFRKTWKTANHKAGLPCIYDIKGKLVRAVRLFHDLRRSAVRELVRTQGLSEREAMMLTGHKTRSVFDRYSVVSQADMDGIRRKLDGGKNGGKSGTGNAGS